MITFLVAPPSAPQVDTPTLAGVQHPLAPEFMQAMRQRGPAPVSLWCVVNGLADARNPDYRARRRCWRLRYWGAVLELLRARFLFRHGPLIALSDFARRPRPKSQGRRPFRPMNGEVHLLPSVGNSSSKTGGSNPVVVRAETAVSGSQVPQNEVVVGNPGTLACVPETKNAVPTVSEVSAAATALARQPRVRKKWSGWLNDRRRSFRNMKVELPTGEEVFVFGVLRRRLVFTSVPDGLLGDTAGVGKSWGVVRADQVQIIEDENAVVLGRSKAGIREAFSPRKAKAARRNGRQPPRPGRRRGRPRTAGTSTSMRRPTTDRTPC